MSQIPVNRRYVLIYPYKFVDTLYTIMGLDGFSATTEIVILDISHVLNREFSNAIKALSTLGNIKKIGSLRDFISEIKNIREQSENIKTCVNYMIPMNSIVEYIINLIGYFYIRNSSIKVINFINTGLPVFDQKSKKSNWLTKIKELSSFRHFFNKKKAFFWYRIPSPMNSLISHKLIAGNYYLDKVFNEAQKYKILKGHSFDFDRCLSLKKGNIQKQDTGVIVFLDEPGPMFASDYKITGETVYKTIEVWYPALCRFFDRLEFLFNARVVIAAHYKSAFTSPSEVFGGREVYYGRTRELIENANLVITEQSTAVSYAVIYKKPIYYIYSDESKQDIWLMNFMKNISELLGQPLLSINHLECIPKTYPLVDRNKYFHYLNEFLTSFGEGRTNSEIIEQEVLI
ncbi:MAG: hypothetical protein HS129_06985 [Leptospiraceae bacterium]|nr:hypothetical protein [Leptospiraceae bacterium]